jgi:4-diphosphocytidyl-2-C-methyl-D-erythritol kinase
LYAPAKLTWNLSVGARADNGLHKIEAEMMSVDLVDEIVLTPGRSGVTVTADGVAATMVPADASNLVVRALSLAGRQASVAITKRIPVGGGLGGGSSDAAAVLRWERIYDHATALSLGSDVAFCVSGGRAMVSGYGEQVEPCERQIGEVPHQTDREPEHSDGQQPHRYHCDKRSDGRDGGRLQMSP